MRFDAVLFDLDGTLLDSVGLILESYRHTLRAHALDARSDEEILAGLGTPLETQLGRWVDDPGEVSRMVETYVTHNLAAHDALVQPFPGVSELVRALHADGVALAVVTSKRRRGTLRGLASLALEGCFQALVCADDVQRPKPDPEPVHRALEALGASALRTAFVGDATHDIHAGRAAGVRTIAVTWGAASRAALLSSEPDHLIEDASALSALLRGV